MMNANRNRIRSVNSHFTETGSAASTSQWRGNSDVISDFKRKLDNNIERRRALDKKITDQVREAMAANSEAEVAKSMREKRERELAMSKNSAAYRNFEEAFKRGEKALKGLSNNNDDNDSEYDGVFSGVRGIDEIGDGEYDGVFSEVRGVDNNDDNGNGEYDGVFRGLSNNGGITLTKLQRIIQEGSRSLHEKELNSSRQKVKELERTLLMEQKKNREMMDEMNRLRNDLRCRDKLIEKFKNVIATLNEVSEESENLHMDEGLRREPESASYLPESDPELFYPENSESVHSTETTVDMERELMSFSPRDSVRGIPFEDLDALDKLSESDDDLSEFV